jgi:S-formylglutathione hydrolase
MELISAHGSFGGQQRFYRHDSRVTGLPMRFSVYLPPSTSRRIPVLFYLAGLTCTEETFPAKAGAQRIAAKLGIALVAPDTSPRGANIPGESDAWDFGVGAGFYLDATQEPWSRHWRMESYFVDELMPLVGEAFPIELERAGIFGHSMGGHGALTLALRHPGKFRSVSAFAPVVAPSQVPWGVKAFTNYLGPDRESWKAHDATELMASRKQPPYPGGILIDQGLDDKFLVEQLKPELFEEACSKAGQPLTLRRHPGYDHSYYFIASFVADHLRHHARALAPAYPRDSGSREDEHGE